jgi:hypothetical protein
MTHKPLLRLYQTLFALLASLAIAHGAGAQPLDDVTLDYQKQGVVATIQLSAPVHYLRHFPASHGKTLNIYYDRVQDAASTEAWVDDEVVEAPPSKVIPHFTVTTRDQAIKPRLVVAFERDAEFSVAPGKDGRSLVITIRPEKLQGSDEKLPFLPVIGPEAKPAAGLTLKQAAAAEKFNKEARALLVQGRDALATKNDEAAVGLLNQLLLLPPNDYTQEALEWVGVARERAGQIDRAKVEYALYLRLYPKGPGAERVAQRMAELGRTKSSPGSPMTVEQTERKQTPTLTTFGGISSRYYYGHSKTSGATTINGVTVPQSQSQVDQSMLITSIDANERYRTEDSDSRLVFRDVNTRNYLANQPSRNQVYAAYGEIKGRADNYLMRVGRQSPTGGGVLGRFDGAIGSYGNAQNLRVNAVAGKLAEYSQGVEPRFFGASMDSGAFSFYGIKQTVEGTLDRRAVGTEFRYFDTKKNAYGLLDYDTYFKEVNAASFMGTARGTSLSPDSTFSFMLDHRKTPSLSIRNALNGASTLSVNDLLQTMSASSLRDLALARTSIANSGQIGITHPWRDKWQIGGDFRLTNQTGLPSSGTPTPTTGPNAGVPTPEGFIQAIPGRGLEKSVTGQLIGSGLYKPGDIWSTSLTLSTSDLVNGNSLFFYNHTQVNSFWMMDVTLQISSFKDQFGARTKQLMPLLRGTYRLTERFSIDADIGYQKIDFNGPQTNSTTTRYFTSAGGRWDF